MTRRGSSCIGNDLRPECLGKHGSDLDSGQFFIDWDVWANRCFVTPNRPIGRTVTGGGPFQTAAAARAAIKTVKGC